MISQQDVSKQIQKNINILDGIGLKAFDSNNLPLETKLSKMPGEELYRYSAPINNKKETLDIIFDSESGDIIGWKKTERVKRNGRINLKIQPSILTYTEDKNVTKTFIMDKLEGTIDKIAKMVDNAIKPNELLQWFDKSLNLPEVKDSEKDLMAGSRVLLLVHGIFSKTEAAFSGLSHSCEQLSDIYGKNIIAYDHCTLCKSTSENASDLLKLLPHGVKLDIVCHSRGAGVVRFMLELEENIDKLNKDGIEVGTVCFVAGACEGSPLATKKAGDDLFKFLAQLMVFTGMKPWTKALGLLMRATAKVVQKFPGVIAMSPDGDEIAKMLKDTKISAANRYAYVRSNFDAHNLIVRFGEEIVIDNIIFKDNGNDCIVPWDGAGVSQNYAKNLNGKKDALLDFGTNSSKQSKVWHTNFFDQPEVDTHLIDQLKK